MTSIDQKAQSPVRILIADDHAVVRQGIKDILSDAQDLVVTEEAETGTQVLQTLHTTKIDLLLIDMEMPEKSGWDVLLDLKTTYPELPVMILSIYPEEHYGMRFLKAGAAAYLSKTTSPDVIIQAIRHVTRGGTFVSSTLAERMVTTPGKDPSVPLHERLSNREFQIFKLLASGTAIKTIADSLSISVTTVSTHRARILEKMGMRKNADLTLYASHLGLLK